MAERVVSVGLVVVPLGVIALWLTLHHKPGWYHPADLDAQGMQQARREAAAFTDLVSDQMVERSPFDIVLSDESITKWIAALPSIWPEGHKRIPPEISDIAVAFDDGVVRIGARYTGSWQAIINVRIELGVCDNGSKLWIRPVRVYGGSVPLPMSMIERMLIRYAGEASNDKTHGIKPASWLCQAENRFVWFNGRRPFRIESIRIVAEKLQLRIEPL